MVNGNYKLYSLRIRLPGFNDQAVFLPRGVDFIKSGPLELIKFPSLKDLGVQVFNLFILQWGNLMYAENSPTNNYSDL